MTEYPVLHALFVVCAPVLVVLAIIVLDQIWNRRR